MSLIFLLLIHFISSKPRYVMCRWLGSYSKVNTGSQGEGVWSDIIDETTNISTSRGLLVEEQSELS